MITIITPSYNRAYIIRKAYESLLVQTSKDFEWLIIDDGSKDNTKEVAEEFIKENKTLSHSFISLPALSPSHNA